MCAIRPRRRRHSLTQGLDDFLSSDQDSLCNSLVAQFVVVIPDRYEFLVYRQMSHRLEAGDLFCRDSVRFRSFEEDLVDDHRWADKEALLACKAAAELT